MLRSNLYDYVNAYIVVKGRIKVNANRRNKMLTFKNNDPFSSCITKIKEKFVDNAENLDIVMPIYNPLEYSDNYSTTSGICGIIIEMNWIMVRMKIMILVVMR